MRRLAALIGERAPLLVARLVSRAALGLLAILLVFFALQRLVPDDPAQVLAGPGASEAAIAATRGEWRLDDPLPVQFAQFAAHLAAFDLGVSTRTHRAVAEDVRAALPISLTFLSGAAIGGLALGLLFALLASTGLAFRLPLLGLAVLGSLPVYGTATALLLAGGRLGRLPHWTEMALPAAALGLPLAQEVARAARASLQSVMRQPYILAARAAGDSLLGAALRHGLRNALRQPLAAFALHAGTMVAGLLVVERLFAWPGLGSYLLDSVAARDLQGSLGACLVFAVMYLALDVAMAVVRVAIDPRLRLE